MSFIKESLVKFFVKFILVSIPLVALWLWVGKEAYAKLYTFLVDLIVPVLGTKSSVFPIPTAFFNNLVPFTVLTLITGSWFSKLKVKYLVLGWFILICGHLLTAEVIYLMEVWKLSESAFNWCLTPLSILSGTLPFILWIILFKESLRILIKTN